MKRVDVWGDTPYTDRHMGSHIVVRSRICLPPSHSRLRTFAYGMVGHPPIQRLRPAFPIPPVLLASISVSSRFLVFLELTERGAGRASASRGGKAAAADRCTGPEDRFARATSGDGAAAADGAGGPHRPPTSPTELHQHHHQPPAWPTTTKATTAELGGAGVPLGGGAARRMEGYHAASHHPTRR